MPARSHRTVDRVVRILEAVSTSPGGLSLADLAKAIDAPKSSLHGFANGLVYAGYLMEHDQRYFLGPGPTVLSLRANRLLSGTVSHDDLAALHERSGCNVLLGVRVGHHIVYTDEVGDVPSLEYVARTRKNRPMLTTGAGRALLAFLGEDELYAVLAAQPDQDAVTRYLDDVDTIRRAGYAVNAVSPSGRGSSVAAPVLD
ncbi:IclR family transcriptional regulator, partial [Streptomyces sp. NPDC055078]